MMAKKRDILLIALFCGFICAMAIGMVFLPKQEVSVNEKRTLADFPKFSAGRIFSGKWESDFESYASDHFPARNFFTGVDSYYMLYSGRNGSKGVYKGQDGYLLNTPVDCDDEMLKDNLEAVNEFAAKTGIKSGIIVVPSAGYIMSDKLPRLHTQYNDDYITYEKIESQLESTELIDIIDVFKQHKDDTQLYYRTDHHWTSAGAYLAYLQYAAFRGFEPVTDFEIECYDGFFGTTYTKSALWGEKPDTIEIWKYPVDISVTINDGADNKEYGSMFFEEYIDELDKYPVFLDGNHAFERLINPGSGGKLLVLKDSYAHCFVPFLINHYSQIDMVDLRYYFEPVSELVSEQDYDEILMVYGISSLCESRDISILE